ncbi:SYT4 [Symbiodinium necroappetens]|uniref:SYT4 protein n=1 Tax=Symbiodinium necroappetens TaxID=1628268 RepID=A0A812ZBH7_9DINO|nr:SYT4 [Symbiodinium necroappetens]
MDLMSGSDPYCVVSVQGPCAVAKPWKGGGLTSCVANDQNPVWEEAFLLEDLYRGEDSLHLSVWNRDSLSSDDPIGCLSVGAEHFWQGLNLVQQLQFENPPKDGECCGWLYASITAYASLEKAKEAAHIIQTSRTPRSRSRITSLWRQTKSHSSSHAGEDVGTDADEPTVIQSCFPASKLRCASRGILSEEREDMKGYAYATAVNGGRANLASKMVTHSWRNKFSHLLAAVLADALNADKYDELAQSLASRQFLKLTEALRKKGQLDVRYWICAFSVNQHTGICASPPPSDSTGYAITPCCCSTAKHFSGELSEMNKFDDMMAYLKDTLSATGKARFEQVVAMEADFSLLTRVWCLAELVEAREIHLPQAIKIHSAAARDLCLDRLAQLDVRDAEASFPSDKDFVLGKIHDPEAFNKDS